MSGGATRPSCLAVCAALHFGLVDFGLDVSPQAACMSAQLVLEGQGSCVFGYVAPERPNTETSRQAVVQGGCSVPRLPSSLAIRPTPLAAPDLNDPSP